MAGVSGVIGRPERHPIPRITLRRADRFAKPDTALRGKGRDAGEGIGISGGQLQHPLTGLLVKGLHHSNGIPVLLFLCVPFPPIPGYLLLNFEVLLRHFFNHSVAQKMEGKVLMGGRDTRTVITISLGPPI